MIELTPTQIKALKLAKDGDLVLRDDKKWTHLNAEVTYLKSDRFRERPQQIKTVTMATVEQLAGLGLLQTVTLDDQPGAKAQGITMAGKMWLLKNK